MQPKIAYLVDENANIAEPSWKFFAENDAPDYVVNLPHWSRPEKIKRIVYWEIEDDEY